MNHQPLVCLLIARGILLLLPGQPCIAQSQPYVYSITNSASYAPAAIAQGSIFVAFGVNLGPSALVKAGSYPLGTQLAGTSAIVNVGGIAAQCRMVYTSAAQIAAILPSDTAVGGGTFTVTYNGQATFPIFVQVVKSAAGVFTVSSTGIGPGIVTGADYVLKTLSKPAKTGEIVIVWLTGLGPLIGGDAAPLVGAQFPDTEVFVGDRAAKVLYAGRSGCCAGLDQIAFEVPAGPRSCFVPVSIRTPGGSSNFVTLPISESGESCSNPTPGIPVGLLTRAANGEQLTVGLIGIGPVAVLQGAGFSFSQGIAEQLSQILHTAVPEADVSSLMRAYRNNNMAAARKIMGKYSDQAKKLDPRARHLLRAAISQDQQGAAATFGRSSGAVAVAPQIAADFPAVGTCLVLHSLPMDATFKSRPLDAGSTLTLDSPEGRKTLSRVSSGQYQALLGAGGTPAQTVPGFYSITGTGGQDIGSFTATLSVTNSLVWTNKSTITEVDRSSPLTITWSGGAVPGYVLVAGTASSPSASALFTCVEETRKGTFTIPQFVLSALPNTVKGTIFITPHPLANPITIPGLDLAFMADGSSDSRTVTFR
jgi:uncharacterized protein (TIGR03437 family)